MEQTTYEGSCHCGAVRYEVTMAAPEKVFAGNCSLCSRAGWLLAMAPGTAFKLLSGEEALHDYQFGKKHLHHQFCATCGVRSFSYGADKDGGRMVAVNVRCLSGLDVSALPVENYDCAKL